MGLDNVAVRWPRTGDWYEPVSPTEFGDFAGFAGRSAGAAGGAVRLARQVAETSTVPASRYTDLVDLLLGLDGVLYATEASEDDEDPVIDPDGCAWIAGGLERFTTAHGAYGDVVTFETVSGVLHDTLRDNRLAEQQIRWLDSRLDARYDATGRPPAWSYTVGELTVLAAFYRRCSERGFAVYANVLEDAPVQP